MSLESQISTSHIASGEDVSPPGPPPAHLAPLHPAEDEQDIAPIWLQRLSLVVLVLFCVYLGVLVTILPWWKRVWDQNLWIQSRPVLAAVLYNGATRGLISGLGLLDIWIGISEAVHYRDSRP